MDWSTKASLGLTNVRRACVWRRVAWLACAVLAINAPARAQSNTRTVRLASAALGETRVLHVSVPPNYKLARQRYPVVILLDGQAKPFFDLTVATVGYNLTGDVHDFAMPAQIVVGVEQGDRGADLARNDVAFNRFLTDELVPYLDREYRTLPYRTLIGHSLGGRFVLASLCRAPVTFAARIAISPSVSDSLVAAVRGCAAAPTTSSSVRQLVMSAGGLETRIVAGVEKLSAHFRDSLSAQWRSTQVDGAGLGHTETPFYTIPDGLRFVFATEFWEIDRTSADSLLQRRGDAQRVLDAALAVVSARVGFRVPASSKWMAEVVRGYLAQSKAELAVAAAQRMIAEYPEELLGYALLADASLARLDVPAARRALTDALAMLDRLEWFDETQREKQRGHFRGALAGLGR